VIYGLDFQTRALAAVTSETDQVRFLIGTQSLKYENQIHDVLYDEDTNTVSKAIYKHEKGEIWEVNTAPAEKRLISTCYNEILGGNTCQMKGSLWRLPENIEVSGGGNEDLAANHELELIAELSDDASDGNQQNLKCVRWQPGENDRLCTVVDSQIVLWDLNNGSVSVHSKISMERKNNPIINGGQWNPHHGCNQFAAAIDTNIHIWDIRSKACCSSIDGAHGQMIRHMDFNPNKQYYLATCGDDCANKFWDMRNVKQPIVSRVHHSHWVWNVRFNHFHDQLVLTSSSDARVVLSSEISISSEPYGKLIEDVDDSKVGQESQQKLDDGVISVYNEYEDSVYCVQWSTADPWIFAALSYDGRLVINKVPRSVKYKILL